MSRSAHVNNKGSALVAVIISMLFIGIIAAIVLSLTRSNLSNSESNKNSSSNFYQGEVYMDELRSELKKLAEVAKKSAYEKWLKSYVAGYSEMSSTDQESKFYELFAEEFQKLIDTTTISKEYDVLDADVNGTGTPLSSADIEIEREDGEIKGIIIKGISLTREDEQGDITTISTDLSLTFQIPPVSTGVNTRIFTSIADFALISDQTVSFDGAGNSSVYGGIYGGGKKRIGTTEPAVYKYEGDGIYVKNTFGISTDKPVEFKSGRIITRTSLKTENGTLRIEGRNSDYAEVWANNIEMVKNSKSNLLIQGKCYVADDLSIDGNNSSFVLKGTGSEYIGYSASQESDRAETNSSIVVNGKNVTLDLSEANRLWLFGKSFVEVPSVWGYRKNETIGIGEGAENVVSSTYMQGESISYRSLQAAYLLPGECINEIGHNPMTDAEISRITREVTENGKTKRVLNDDSVINIDNTGEAEIYLRPYLNESNPVYIASVTYGTGHTGTKLWYLYMNFKDPNAAADYMQVYANKLAELTSARMEMSVDRMSGSGQTTLKVNTSKAGGKSLDNASSPASRTVINTGNILTYDSSLANNKLVLYEKNMNYFDQFIYNQQTVLSENYKRLYTSLDLNSIGKNDLTDTIANFDFANDYDPTKAITQIEEASNPVYFHDPLGGTEKRPAYMIATTQDVEVYSDHIVLKANSEVTSEISQNLKGSGTTGIAGIIVTTGNVRLMGCDFWGTVIAKGNIECSSSICQIKSSKTVKELLEANNTVVIPYFTHGSYNGFSDEDAGSDYIYIDYKNWKKD